MSPHNATVNKALLGTAWQQWWSTKGSFMGVEKSDLEKKELVIGNGNLARLTITKCNFEGAFSDEKWLVKWYILHEYRGTAESNNEVRGQVIMTEKELRAAFGLPGGVIGNGALAKHFGADVMVQGRFIRQSHYLNIPMPGSTMQGDPNISIFIHPVIREAVGTLLAAH